jgi:DNA-binding winged helix-turn-helix (wHTH) protein
VLLILLSRVGRTVSIETLQRMLAAEKPISENAIQQIVSSLRRELEASGIRISAVPRRGYRLERYNP